MGSYHRQCLVHSGLPVAVIDALRCDLLAFSEVDCLRRLWYKKVLFAASIALEDHVVKYEAQTHTWALGFIQTEAIGCGTLQVLSSCTLPVADY